jgi:hypothetical protein
MAQNMPQRDRADLEEHRGDFLLLDFSTDLKGSSEQSLLGCDSSDGAFSQQV